MEAAYKVLARVYTTATQEQVKRKVGDPRNPPYPDLTVTRSSSAFSTRPFDKASRSPTLPPFGNDLVRCSGPKPTVVH